MEQDGGMDAGHSLVPPLSSPLSFCVLNEYCNTLS